MSDYDVYDASAHAVLEEILDLLKQSRVAEYTVVCNKFKRDTINEVNDLIRQGWRPVGGIHSTYQTEWAQAMTRGAAPTKAGEA